MKVGDKHATNADLTVKDAAKQLKDTRYKVKDAPKQATNTDLTVKDAPKQLEDAH